MNVGQVTASAGVRVEDAGFLRWKREWGKVQSEAKQGATAQLSAKLEEQAFDRYGRAIKSARSDALKGAKTKLEADAIRGGFTRYERSLQRARTEGARGATAKLDTALDLSGFRRFQREVSGADRSIARVRLGAGRLGATLATGGAGVAGGLGLGAGLLVAARAGVRFNAQMESGTLALQRYAGGAEKARAFMLLLAQDAEQTPFELTDLLTGTRRLASFGLELGKSREILRAVGDAVAAAGGSAEHIDRVTLALGQMQARGKVSGEELLQLTEAGIPAYKILAEELNLTGEEVGKIGLLGIKSEVAINALTRGLTREFGGAAKEQSRTFDGMMSTLRDNWARTTGAMTTGLFAALKRWAPAVNGTLAEIREIFERPDLSLSEKIQRSLEVAKVNLGPMVREIKREIDKVPFTRLFNDALEFALPRVAEAGARIGLAIVKATGKAIVESDFLGRALIIGYITKKLGLWRLAGVMLGRQVGIGIGAGAATTVAGGGGAAAAGGLAGLAGKLKGLAKTAGFVGVGIAVADQVLGAINSRMREGSDNLGERLRGFADRDLGERLGAVTGGGDLDEMRSAKALQGVLADIQQKHRGISEETATGARHLAEQLKLTEAQRDQVDRILDVGRARTELSQLRREAAREGIRVKVNLDTPGRSTQLLASLRLMREGVFTSMREIDREVATNSRRIRETLGRDSAEGRHALVENFQAAVVNVGVAMRNGEISTRTGMRRIRGLLRNARLVEGDDPFGLGRGFARSIDNAGSGARQVTRRVVSELKQMPAGARTQAIATMTATVREMERRKDVPAGTTRRMKAAVLAQFRDMRTRSAVNAGELVANVGAVFGGLPKAVQPGVLGLFTFVQRALRGLGARSDLKLPTLPDLGRIFSSAQQLRGNNRGGIIRRARGGVIPGTGRQDTVLLNAGAGDAISNDHQTPIFDFALRTAQLLGEPYGAGSLAELAAGGSSGGGRPALVAPGEIHVPRSKRSAVDQALGLTRKIGAQPYGTMEQVFGSVRRRHDQGYARGGSMVDPPWDPGAEVLSAAISGTVGRWARAYGADMTAGYDPGGGHVSPGHNVTGTATDMVPRGGWTRSATALLERGLRALVAKGVKVLYGTDGIGIPWPNHGRGNHAHIEWGGAGGEFAVTAPEIPRIEVQGRGPLRDLAQGSLDRVRRGAAAYLDKKAGEAVYTGPALGDKDSPGRGGALSKADLMRLWRSAGGRPAAANIAAAIALAESSGDPRATSHNPVSGGRNLGAWQIDAGSHKDATLDPLGNARAAVRISGNGRNWGPWETYGSGAYRQYLNRGGIIGRLVEAFNRGGTVQELNGGGAIHEGGPGTLPRNLRGIPLDYTLRTREIGKRPAGGKRPGSKKAKRRTETNVRVKPYRVPRTRAGLPEGAFARLDEIMGDHGLIKQTEEDYELATLDAEIVEEDFYPSLPGDPGIAGHALEALPGGQQAIDWTAVESRRDELGGLLALQGRVRDLYLEAKHLIEVEIIPRLRAAIAERGRQIAAIYRRLTKNISVLSLLKDRLRDERRKKKPNDRVIGIIKDLVEGLERENSGLSGFPDRLPTTAKQAGDGSEMGKLYKDAEELGQIVSGGGEGRDLRQALDDIQGLTGRAGALGTVRRQIASYEREAADLGLVRARAPRDEAAPVETPDAGQEQQGVLAAILALGREFGNNIQTFHTGIGAGPVRGSGPSVMIEAKPGEWVLDPATNSLRLNVTMPEARGGDKPSTVILENYEGPVTQQRRDDDAARDEARMWSIKTRW